jgi:hypothetical protein
VPPVPFGHLRQDIVPQIRVIAGGDPPFQILDSVSIHHDLLGMPFPV